MSFYNPMFESIIVFNKKMKSIKGNEMKNKERIRTLRREKYAKLTASGFTHLEATKYKDRASKTVEALCDVKTKHETALLSELEGILERKAKK